MTLLHERLHWLRKQAGLTLAEVSAQTGSAVGFLSDLECGRSLPSLVTLEREEYDRARRAAPVYIRLASPVDSPDANKG